MKVFDVVRFVDHYIAGNGVITDPEYLVGPMQLKEQWVPLAHALDRLSDSLSKSLIARFEKGMGKQGETDAPVHLS